MVEPARSLGLDIASLTRKKKNFFFTRRLILLSLAQLAHADAEKNPKVLLGSFKTVTIISKLFLSRRKHELCACWSELFDIPINHRNSMSISFVQNYDQLSSYTEPQRNPLLPVLSFQNGT
jgi:hypothetical protein